MGCKPDYLQGDYNVYVDNVYLNYNESMSVEKYFG